MISFYQQGVADGNRKTLIVSTINGDANTFFYTEISRQYKALNITPDDLPIVAFSVGEAELTTLTPVLSNLTGHYAAWNYFMSVNNSLNNEIIKAFLGYQNTTTVVNDPMEAHYIGFNMWVASVLQSGTTYIPAVKQAMYRQTLLSLSGYNVTMNTNHHLSKPVLIGKIQATGQFSVINSTDTVIKANPWNPAIHPDNPICDWAYPYVCSFCNASAPQYVQIGLN